MWKALDMAAVVFAFAAAGFWFASAAGEVPPMLEYWGSVPLSDPFYQAVKMSARLPQAHHFFILDRPKSSATV